MRAITIRAGQAHLTEEPEPTAAPGEVLIRVRLAGICATDLELIKGYAGFEGVLGHEFVGVVASKHSPLAGKRVAGEINCVCGKCDMCNRGLSPHCRRRTVVGISGRGGAFAELLALPERNCHVVPDSVTDEEAVFVEPLAAAFQMLRQVKIDTKTSVAVLGTGRLGLLVAQVFASTNCRLTAIGRNPRTLGFLDRRRIRTGLASELTQWNDQDVVIDCTGSPEGLPLALRLVRPRGTIVMKTTCHGAAPVDLSPLVVNEVTLLGSRCGPFGEALAALARKEIDVRSMISRTMPLAEGVSALQAAADPQNIKVLLSMA